MTQVLRPLKQIFQHKDHPQVLVGLSEPDDAAVYQLDAERAIISTTDFFPPVVDDAYAFGAISAANALSDVYAMGGKPLLAINLVAFPDDLDTGLLTEILRGGADKVKEAGAVIAGGHSITDAEPKYGLSVTGLVSPQRIMRKSGAKAGDRLILSKALGTGVITTAHKRDLVADEHLAQAVQSMERLNRHAAKLAQQHNVQAMTDITGFGLAGHALEMARLSHVDFVIHIDKLRTLPGTQQYARQGIFPGGLQRNADYYQQWVTLESALADYQEALLYDPQTSGGLLMAVAPQDADALLAGLLASGEAAYELGEVVAGAGVLLIRG